MKSETLIQCPLCHLRDHKTRHHFEPVALRRARHEHLRSCGHEPPPEKVRTIYICRPCHDAIHFLFSHQELAKQFNSLSLIAADPEVRMWVMRRRQDPSFRMKGKTHRVLAVERDEAMRRVAMFKGQQFVARWRQLPHWKCRKCKHDNPGPELLCQACQRPNPSSFMVGHLPGMRNASIHYGGHRTVSVRFAGRTVGGAPVIIQLWDGSKWQDCNEAFVSAALADLMRHGSPPASHPAEVR